MTTKRVLVTGANGFLGQYTLGPLHDLGFEVHAVSQRSQKNSTSIQWHSADLLDAHTHDPLIRSIGATHLLHFAWYTEHGKFWESPLNDSWGAASLSLAQSFVRHGGKRMVVAGTCAEYARSDTRCLEGVTRLEPSTRYGKAKHQLHIALKDVALSTPLFSLAWGRIFHAFGPRELPNRLVPTIVRSLLQGKEALCSPGTQVRDYCYSDNVSDAFVRLTASHLTGPFNIASGTEITLAELSQRVAAKLGRPELLRLGALPLSPTDPPILTANTQRLDRELGWKPPISLDEGIERTIEWWREKNL